MPMRSEAFAVDRKWSSSNALLATLAAAARPVRRLAQSLVSLTRARSATTTRALLHWSLYSWSLRFFLSILGTRLRLLDTLHTSRSPPTSHEAVAAAGPSFRLRLFDGSRLGSSGSGSGSGSGATATAGAAPLEIAARAAAAGPRPHGRTRFARRRRGEVGQARVARRAFRAAQRRHPGAVGVCVAVLLLRVAVLRGRAARGGI